MPPDLFGNIAASSAWMLFCSAPRQIEIVHRTKAPVVPRAPIEPPSAAIRNPGLRERDDEAVPPRHRLEELSLLDLGVRHPASLSLGGGSPSYQLVHGAARLSTTPLGRVSTGCVLSCREMAMLRDRSIDAAPRAPERTRARPVVLATMAEGFHPSAERMAIDSAIEAGVPLLVVNLIPLPLYVRTMTLVGRGGHHAAARGAPRRGPRHSRAGGRARRGDRAAARAHPACRCGRCSRWRPSATPGCSCSGPSRPATLRFRLTARRLRREADCLVWIAPDG